jgi:hypothetical protein
MGAISHNYFLSTPLNLSLMNNQFLMGQDPKEYRRTVRGEQQD